MIERVYLPPPGTHGRAYSRYSVAVWDFFGRGGHLEIHGRAVADACPFFEPYTGASADDGVKENSAEVDCVPTRYSISLTTTLRAGDPNQASAIQDRTDATSGPSSPQARERSRCPDTRPGPCERHGVAQTEAPSGAP